MRVYDHEDAMLYEEGMREMAGEEPGGDYEFPEVEKAMPLCIRSSWKGNYAANVRRFVALNRELFLLVEELEELC